MFGASSISVMLSVAGKAALAEFGQNAQMIKTCEELGELSTQLCKRLNGSPTTDAAIIDEVADVLIMANQMRTLFGAEAVDTRIEFKLNRTMQFIQKRKEERNGNVEVK